MSEVAVAPSQPNEPPPPTADQNAKPAATETPLSPNSLEHRYERNNGNADDDDEDDVGKGDDDDDEEGAKEEDDLFTSLEKEQEGQELGEQPKEVTAAPRLLQKALTAGEVKEESSDDDEKKDDGKVIDKSAEADEVGKPHVHQRVSTKIRIPTRRTSRSFSSCFVCHCFSLLPVLTTFLTQIVLLTQVNQLEFLLDKASEYSNFIAQDLEELQQGMAMEAKKALTKTKGKKRKGDSAATTMKKLKNSKGKATLASAQAKDTMMRAGNRPIFVQPANLAGGCTLKDYQLEGVRWMASLYENGVSGILADEMGLGKTIQCIALIAHLLTKGVSGPFMVVAPLATLPNWVREFQKWLPDHPVVRYHGPAAEREAMLKGPLHYKQRRQKDFPFIVTSYEVAIRDQSKLEKLSEFTYLIVDEGHRLKNHRCTLLTSLKRLRAANRLLLTGTPIQNTLNELWSLLNFVNPQIFDDLSVFQSWFGFRDIGTKKQNSTSEEAILLEQRQNQTVSKLHEILRPFLLRRIKTDVLSEMPPKKEVIVYSGVSKLQAGYAALIDKGTLRETLLSQGIEDGRTLSQTNQMMNHRKNINHPFLFGEPHDPATGVHLGTAHPQLLVRASGKFALLDRMLERLHKDGHQVLIFSQMTKVLSIMEDYLNFRKWKYCRIDGSTNIDERQKQMDQFNAEKTGGVDGKRNTADDRHFVFLLSTRAGGLGINLTAADTVRRSSNSGIFAILQI